MISQTLAATKAATFCVQLPSADHQGMPIPTGTGFFVSPDGWFVTAAHVVTEDNTLGGSVRQDLDQAWLMQETRNAGGAPGAGVQFVSFHQVLPEFDVALLKVDFSKNADKEWLKLRSGFPHLTVSSRQLDEGEPVYSFGYPLSTASTSTTPGGTVVGTDELSPRVTSAIVSSTFEHSKMVITAADAKVYVLDKALNYGNSGGPIVAADSGHVHAVCSRFQPLWVPQDHLKVSIMVPSLYRVVSSLGNMQVLQLLDSLGISIDDA